MVYSPAPIMSALTGIFIDLSGDPFPRVCPGAFKYLPRRAGNARQPVLAADSHDERVPIRTTLTEDGLRRRLPFIAHRRKSKRSLRSNRRSNASNSAVGGNAMWRSTSHFLAHVARQDAASAWNTVMLEFFEPRMSN